MRNILRFHLSFFMTSNYSLNFFRGIRNPSKRLTFLKTLKEFKVKDVHDEDEYDSSFDLKEMSKRVKENDLDLEEHFEKDQDFETIKSKIYDMQISEENRRVSIKKKLIGRKYFKSGKETNLLTHAAKEQIRYLHRLDPSHWTPETLSKSFPISVDGVKKLFRSNFTLEDPVKIKEHDEDVRKKWELLASGKPSDEIHFYTQCLWNDGKLLKENYNGNPHLPYTSASTTQKIIKIKSKKPTGEFSAIIKNYIEHKNRTQSEGKNNSELTVLNGKEFTKKGLYEETEHDLQASHFLRKSKIFKEDGDLVVKKKDSMEEAELPFSQFKENLRHLVKHKSKKCNVSQQYDQWIEQDLKEKEFKNAQSYYNSKEFVSKIPKYNKENIQLKRDKNKSVDLLYLYNEKLGYQLPVGQTVKGKIRVPTSVRKKKSLYRVKQCVYDENGELLYKLPG